MIIRDMGQWDRYTLQYRGSEQVPSSPPSWPCIVRTMELDSPPFVLHSFYTVEDMEMPTQETEYMSMMPEYPDFQRIALQMLGCRFEEYCFE